MHVKFALFKECARAAPDIRNFVCSDCILVNENAKAVAAAAIGESNLAAAPVARLSKSCPGCGSPIEKDGGCNHITCPIEGCFSHWCWTCGLDEGGDGKFDKDNVYDHMATCGGIFN